MLIVEWVFNLGLNSKTPKYAKSNSRMHLSNEVSGAIRTFTYFMASGTHYMLKGVDYISLYGEEPSAIEQAYAIFINVLEVDEFGKVLNVKHAEKRATDYIRSYCLSSFEVDPPYKDWEISLY
ncbi:unnamed protein product [Kluyveromyces dobzhanskii CBS 2104]|uniref:WGS project CCBQ000000000 data, contig 00104 n=1 Tax=Kluyveromyces dobzhanskii CBS 2104 TaxID=1427455 RepID=A0A0A8L5Z2_9SACH|nr:unnamed protein product [Kluyveromyces dobzhanskii CBS 2104]